MPLSGGPLIAGHLPELRGLLWLLVKVGWPRSMEARLTVAALASCVAVLSTLTMATIAAPEIMHASQARYQALTPQTVEMGTGGEPIGLRTLPGRSGDTDRMWHRHRITRQYYSAEPRAAQAVKGVTSVPKSGTYYASPDLQELMKKDSLLEALFDNLTLVGTISDEGLVQPHELRAVIGVPVATKGLVEVTGFGASPLLAQGPMSRSPDIPVMIAVLAIIWVPGTVLLVVAVRLAGRRRLRRSQALRLLGLSRVVAGAFGAAEVAAVSLPAALGGTTIYRCWVHLVTKISGTDWGYRPGDADPGLIIQCCVVAGWTTLAGLVAASAVKERAAPAVRVGQVASTTLSRLGVATLGIGVVYGLVALRS